ncbi:MAG: transcription termination/antitermination protein NusA, partial [Caldilineales bacterium]|nr:transcription termination/antitermination protein NusA [Caldilineales bacterium]
EAVEQALVSAYRRNFGSTGNVEAHLDPESGDMRIYARYDVVPEDEIIDHRIQVSPEEAADIDPAKTKPGDVILVERTPEDFGRIAAQTAKQVILQRIREAERDAVFDDYVEREGELVQGSVRSIDHGSGNVVVSLDSGRAEGVLARADQIHGERYRHGGSVLAYVSEVSRGTRGPAIHLSRTHRNMLRRLMEKEVPEIKQGVVEIKAIAREAGSRSKVAVTATQQGVDPVGSCVGMRGVRIQNIVNELSGEKIDVIEWNPDNERFVANALSPARVTDVLLFPEHDRTAVVIVPDNQLSLAIGKEGQNARLVAKLTSWRIDIKSETEAAAEGLDEQERQRLRAESKERAEADDLLEAARRMLADGELDLLSEVTLEPVDTLPEGVDLLDMAALAIKEDFDDALTEVDLEAVELPAEDESQATEPEPKPAAPAKVLSEEELEARALASRLSEAMTSFDDEAAQIDLASDMFSRLFGESDSDRKYDDSDEEDEDDESRSKKKRRKDRRLVFDENQGRTVAIKKHKRGRGGSKGFEYSEFDEDF